MNKTTLPFLIILFLQSPAAFSQGSEKPISIDNVMALKTLSDPQISPDGKWVAFTVAENDLKKDKSESRIWMISTNGGEAIPMTAKGYSASQPRWSPDNKFLSFLAAKTEEEKTQVWTLNRLGGESQQLTKIKQGVVGHEWSPVGKRLLLSIKDPKPEELTNDKEDDKKTKPIVVDRLQFKQDNEGYLNRYRTHLYTFAPGDTTAIQITSGDYDDNNPVWSPEGKSIAFESNRSDNPDGNYNTDIWIVSADNTDKGQNLRQVTTNPIADTSPAWSPDGKSIAYITQIDKDAIWYATEHLAIVSADGGPSKVLTDKLDRHISKPKFSKDGQSIFFILEESGTRIIASIETSGKNLQRTISGEISISDYSLRGSTITPLLGKYFEPAEIFAYKNKALTQLTNLNEAMLAGVQKTSIEKIHFNSEDGTEIEGFVIKPYGFDSKKKYPAILWIHGGPVGQFEYGNRMELNLFAASGYVTLLINPRGSSGYGQAFSEAIFADWGNKDYQDLMAGVDYAIEEGYVDPNRMGVGGWSYGGILTNYVITKTARFKGAISGASCALYRANYGHDQYQLLWEDELGLPWETPEAWERISPFNHVAKITTPTLWMGGAIDWNVPIQNSEQMYQAMKRLGRETQLVIYPEEHHALKKPSFNKDRLERYLQWFDKYVKP